MSMEALLKKEIVTNKIAVKSLTALFFLTALALSAFVRIPLPFTPVPATMQTFVIMCMAAFAGRGAGLAAVAAYLTFGAAGVPWFTNAGSGWLYLAGPTAGYLWAFVPAFLAASFILRGGSRSPVRLVVAFLAAEVIIFTAGVLWLRVYFAGSFAQAFAAGAAPFIAAEGFKLMAAVAVSAKARGSFRR